MKAMRERSWGIIYLRQKTYNIIRSSANGIMRDGMVRLGAACSADHALRKRENTDFFRSIYYLV